jgi:hypothetical protein
MSFDLNLPQPEFNHFTEPDISSETSVAESRPTEENDYNFLESTFFVLTPAVVMLAVAALIKSSRRLADK